MGLNESFGQLHSQILASDPLPSINRCYVILHQEETQRLVQQPTPQLEVSTFTARSSTPSQPPSRPHRTWAAGTNLCEVCGKSGHPRTKCFEVIGYPDWWPSKNKGGKTRLSSLAVHQVSVASNTPTTSGVTGLSTN